MMNMHHLYLENKDHTDKKQNTVPRRKQHNALKLCVVSNNFGEFGKIIERNPSHY